MQTSTRNNAAVMPFRFRSCAVKTIQLVLALTCAHLFGGGGGRGGGGGGGRKLGRDLKASQQRDNRGEEELHFITSRDDSPSQRLCFSATTKGVKKKSILQIWVLCE